MQPKRLPIRTTYPDTYGDQPVFGVPYPAVEVRLTPRKRITIKDFAALFHTLKTKTGQSAF